MLAKIVIRQGKKLIEQSKKIEEQSDKIQNLKEENDVLRVSNRNLRISKEKDRELLARIKTISENNNYNNTKIALRKINELVITLKIN